MLRYVGEEVERVKGLFEEKERRLVGDAAAAAAAAAAEVRGGARNAAGLRSLASRDRLLGVHAGLKPPLPAAGVLQACSWRVSQQERRSPQAVNLRASPGARACPQRALAPPR
jgi:hypothetical protein